jgi:DNA-binding YbaB/EbfC family protein
MYSVNRHMVMKQIEKMQADMIKLQEELAEKTLETTAGGGAVKVVVNGKQELVGVTIDPEVVDKDDVEMLQDLIIAAVNEGLRQSKEMSEDAMAQITKKIPGMPNFF